MTRTDAIAAITVRLDELSPFSGGTVALDSDALAHPVRRYIEDTLDEATDAVRMIAPLNRLDKKELGDNIATKQLYDEIVYHQLPLPPDFLRIARIRMNNWERACTQAVAHDGEAYRLLKNPHTTAGTRKPAVAVVGNTLELYGSRIPEASLQEKEYIHRWLLDDTEKTVDALVLEAIYWRCAIEVLSIMERKDAAKMAQEFYQEALNLLTLLIFLIS
jgi:hypothetical protein